MADALPTILAFPPDKHVSAKEYDKQISNYLKNLDKLADSTWTKAINKQNILDLLNPAVNTIPYLFALNDQCHAAGKDRTRIEDALTRSLVFLTTFDAVQVRYVGEQWRVLMEWAFEWYPKAGMRDLSPLSISMLRLDPTAGTFTTNHLRLLRLCLEMGVPSQALSILDKNIYAFPQVPTKNIPDDLLSEDHDLSNAFITAKSGHSLILKSEYVLEYYLLGAHIYIGMRDYSRARLFLEYVILSPSSQHAYSAFQAEAYKKWVLVGLLAQGKAYPLPRTHDQQAMKSMRALSKAYEALSENFEKRKWRKFAAEMEAGAQLWNEDGNLRLVKEVGDALLRYRVVDLQKTYAALPVSRVATHLSLQADITLQILTDMIRQGHLHASVTPAHNDQPSDAVLHFHPPSGSSSATNDTDLEAQTLRIQALISHIHGASHRLELSKEYVEFAKRNKRAGIAGGGLDGDLADQMDLTWDPPITGTADGDGDEEDIMS